MATLSELVVRIDADISGMQRNMSAGVRAVNEFGQRAQAAGRALTVGLTLPLAGIGVAAISAAAEMDSLRRGLTAVSGSVAATEQQLARLQEVAKLPGLGFREAIQGSINLQAAGLNASLAERSLRAFGNALATVGRGKSDLEGVITALGQIASKGKISAEEINQLAERVPQIRTAMQSAFGTADTELLGKAGIGATEFITRITEELAKLPQVTGGVQNAFENLSDSWFRARVAIGEQLLPAVIPLVEGLSAMLVQVRALSPETLRTGIAIASAAAVMGPMVVVAGSLTTAITALVAAGASLSVVFGVGGVLVLGLGLVISLFAKAGLEALAAAANAQAAAAQFRVALTGMSDDTLQASLVAQNQSFANLVRSIQETESLLETARTTAAISRTQSAWNRVRDLDNRLKALRGILHGTPEVQGSLARLQASGEERARRDEIANVKPVIPLTPAATTAVADGISDMTRKMREFLEQVRESAKEMERLRGLTGRQVMPSTSTAGMGPALGVGGVVDNSKLLDPVFRAMRDLKAAGDDGAKGATASVDAMRTMEIGLADLASVMGHLSAPLRSAITGLAGLSQGISTLIAAGNQRGFAAFASGIAGVGAVVGGAVSAMTALRDMMGSVSPAVAAVTASLRELRLGAMGFEVNRSGIDRAIAAIEEILKVPGGLNQNALLNQAIVSSGLTKDQFIAIAEAIFPALLNAQGQIQVGFLDEFLEALRLSTQGTNRFADSVNKATAAMLNAVPGYRLMQRVWQVQDARSVLPPGSGGGGTALPPTGPATVSLSFPLAGGVGAPNGPATYRALYAEWRQQSRSNPAMLAWFNTLPAPV